VAIADHVLGGIGGGALERVAGPVKEVFPQRGGDELEGGED